MSDVFHLQIISPSAVVLDTSVSMVEVPGSEGDFGVLPHHAPFFSMIRPGIIRAYHADGHRKSYFATSGYVDVSPEGTTILSDHLQAMSDISISDAQEALAAAQQAMAQAETEHEKKNAGKLLAAAEALVFALSH